MKHPMSWTRSIPWDYTLGGGLLGLFVAPLTTFPLMVGGSFVALLFLITAIRESPAVLGWLIAKRWQLTVAGTIFLWLVSAGYVLIHFVTDGSRLSPLDILTTTRAPHFLLFGLVVAVFLRHVMEQLSLFYLLGWFKSRWEILLLLLWGISVFLFLWTDGPLSQATFLIGAGAGLILHKSVRLSFARAVAADRRIQEIADAWPNGEKTSKGDLEALKLLARGRQFPSGRFKKLRAHLEALRQDASKDPRCWGKHTALISATAYRLEGDYLEAIDETRSLSADSLEELVDAHLLLLRIICLNEIGKTSEAEALIEAVLSSEHGPCCPLTHALKAEVLARRCLVHPTSARVDGEALQFAHRALTLRSNIVRDRAAEGGTWTEDGFLSRFIEIGVPITSSFLTNILGLGYLAAGEATEARGSFAKCISFDPMMSSPYMHLGDYFLFRGAFTRKSLNVRDRDIQHARAAYYAAKFVEGVKQSRVHNMVAQRLRLAAELEGGPAKLERSRGLSESVSGN